MADEFVRVRVPETGHHITTTAVWAEINNLEHIDEPAVDSNGRPLPPKYNVSVDKRAAANKQQKEGN